MSPKWGAGHVAAMARAGAKEIAQILPAFPTSSVQPVQEPGLVGNLTPSEVVETKGGQESIIEQYGARGSPIQEDRPMER
jgi:hypothetical protein